MSTQTLLMAVLAIIGITGTMIAVMCIIVDIIQLYIHRNRESRNNHEMDSANLQ